MKFIIAIIVPVLLIVGGIMLAINHIEGWGWLVVIGAVVYLVKDVEVDVIEDNE